MAQLGFGESKRMKQRTGGANFTRYKAQVGSKDVIRLVDEAPYLSQSHYLEDLSRGFTCSKEFDADKQCFTGDCPLCEDNCKASERFTVKIIHIQRGNEAIKKFRLWQFGLDKYQQISAIADEMSKPINEVDLVVACADEKYQRLNIFPSQKVRNFQAASDSDFDISSVTAPVTYDSLVQQLQEARNTSSSSVDTEDIDDDEDIPEPAGATASNKGASSSDDFDDDMSIDDLLGD